ncbi:MAG TPA: pyridoxal-phosphate dependent enzyme [Thermoanaerobaculia bacterium]|nr:pyridoxal-phosphate dependent enzyme [Thermoanaerobaculia bacterium]
MEVPTFAHVQAAAGRIAPFVHRTPVLTSETLDAVAGATLLFKAEPLQKSGSFKMRGAANAVLSLPEAEATRGVATHSSGNHGAALSRAATLRGIPCWVVMPEGAPAAKRQAVAAYGGSIVPCAPTLKAREESAARLLAETGARFVHPYEDPAVVAGQGTCALELLAQAPAIDLLLVPLGGGGLLSGTLIAARELAPAVEIVGVEPAGADDAARSLAAGVITPLPRPETVADGLRATLGELAFAVLREHRCRVVTVADDAIVEAMRLIWQRLKLVAEPSAAVPLAAVLSGAVEAAGRRVGVVLSGGNVDLPR